MNIKGLDRGVGAGRDVDDSQLLTGDGNNSNHVNVYATTDTPHHQASLTHRVERLERATFGDDAIGLYGVIRQQQQLTRWLQILAFAQVGAELLRFFVQTR